MNVAPGTIQVWSDLLCPIAQVAIHRLRTTRAELGLDGVVRLDHHTFALELFNGPHSRPGTDSEAVGLGQLAPEIGFRLWTQPDWTYPSTVLLAAEAVHAAKAQGLQASEDLDAALDDGRARSAVMGDHAVAVTDAVQGSPHLFLPDGTGVHNPGIEVHWEGPWASGYPIAQGNDPDWPKRLLHAAAR